MATPLPQLSRRLCGVVGTGRLVGGRSRFKRQRSGFALVISVGVTALVGVMMLLMYVSVGVLSSQSQHELERLRARLEARYALACALGRLQVLAGPDARVSASAGAGYAQGVLAPWTGVWHARKGDSLHGQHLGWLVSQEGGNPFGGTPEGAISAQGEVAEDFAVLVGGGALPLSQIGVEAAKAQWVLLPKQEGYIPKAKSLPLTRYAWWIGDEGQKATLGAPPLSDVLTASRVGQWMRWSAQEGAALNVFGEGPRTELRVPEASIPEGAFHALGTRAYGVLTDVPAGRLKRDLSAGLGNSATFERELAGKAVYDLSQWAGYEAVRAYAPMGEGVPWEWLRDFYKSYVRVSQREDGEDAIYAASAYAQGGVAHAAAQLGGWHNPHDEATLSPVPKDSVRRASTAAYLPVLSRYEIEYSVAWERDGNYCKLGLRPIVVLHNPYDVWLKDVHLRVWANVRHDITLRVGEATLKGSDWAGSLLWDAQAWGFSEKAWPQGSRQRGLSWEIQGDLPPGAFVCYALGEAQDVGDSDGQSSGGDASQLRLTSDFSEPQWLYYHRLERTGSPRPEAKEQSKWQFWPKLQSIGLRERLSAQLDLDPSAEAQLFVEDMALLDEFGEPVRVGRAHGLNFEGALMPVTIPAQSLILEGFSALPFGRYVWQRKPASVEQINDWATVSMMQSTRAQPEAVWAVGNAALYPDELTASAASAYGLYFEQTDDRDGGSLTLASFVEDGLVRTWGGGGLDGSSGSPSVVLHELPRAPLFSLGQLQHALLQTQAHDPALGVGNARRPSEALWGPLRGDDKIMTSTLTQSATPSLSESVLVDSLYVLNEALFDAYFFSTIPPESREQEAQAAQARTPVDYARWDKLDYTQYFSGAGVGAFAQFDEQAWAAGLRLPNPAYVRVRGRGWESTTGDYAEANLKHLRGYRSAAANLMVQGAFNVNSTQVQAWAALLSNFRQEATEPVRMGRFLYHDNEYTQQQENPWLSAPSLPDEALWQLAEAIVLQVRARGPFLSMGDFVNRARRPAEGTPEDARLAGALEAAIEASGINASWESLGWGAAGYLSQGDLLTLLAPVASVRSDTFRVRAYGEAVNPLTGEASAQAWCEVLVQRVVEPVWESQEALDLDGVVSPSGLFGRRFRVLSFRWLRPDEV